jgi:hypothetical protein
VRSPKQQQRFEDGMADDELRWIEAALGAVSKLNVDEGQDGLYGVRCPKCEASDFVRVSDLYAQSVARLEEDPSSAHTVRDGGMTDIQIVEKFSPPRRKSAAGVTVAVAVPLAAGAFYLYRRVGDNVGQIAGAVAIVVTAIVLMSSLRRLSDQYYHRRRRWNSLFMCRRCGQLVAS